MYSPSPRLDRALFAVPRSNRFRAVRDEVILPHRHLEVDTRAVLPQPAGLVQALPVGRDNLAHRVPALRHHELLQRRAPHLLARVAEHLRGELVRREHGTLSRLASANARVDHPTARV